MANDRRVCFWGKAAALPLRQLMTHFDILAGSFAAVHNDAQLECARRLATASHQLPAGQEHSQKRNSRDPVPRDLMPE